MYMFWKNNCGWLVCNSDHQILGAFKLPSEALPFIKIKYAPNSILVNLTK